MENAAKVGLRVGNRTWHVKLDHYPKHYYHRLAHGWLKFMRECKLKLGDVCDFELVDKDMFIFEVKVEISLD